MDLQIIDTFVRSEAAPKAAPRSTDDAPESFADILDTRLKSSEPVRERPEMPEARETSQEPLHTKPAEVAEAKTAEAAPAAKPRIKPKAEHDAKDTSGSETAAPTDVEETPLVKGPAAKSATALLVAELLNTTDSTSGDAQPNGLEIAAAILASVTPEKAAASSVLSLLTTPATPQPGDATVTPVTAASALASAAAPAQTSAPATTPAANTATTDFALDLGAATAQTPVPVATPTPAKLPEAPMVAAELAAMPAATTIAAAIQPQADKPDAFDLAADLSDSLGGDDILATVTLTSPSSTASRTSPLPGTTSGYTAQLVSQAPVAASSSAVTPDVVKPAEIATSPDKGAQNVDLTAEGDKTLLAAAAPATSSSVTPIATPSTTDHSVRATAQAEAVAQRGTRPAALPVVEQVAVRISKAISDGVDRINVKLNPADLGQIDIRMEIGPDGKFNAVFAADRPQTVELLQRDARELARSLQDAGLRTDAGSLSFNLRGQNQGQANGSQSGTPQYASDSSSTDLPAEAMPTPANIYNSSNAANGRVDIRV